MRGNPKKMFGKVVSNKCSIRWESWWILLGPGIQMLKELHQKESHPSWGSKSSKSSNVCFYEPKRCRNKRWIHGSCEDDKVFNFNPKTLPDQFSRLSKSSILWWPSIGDQVTHARMATNHPNPAVSLGWKNGALMTNMVTSATPSKQDMFVNQGI